MRGRSYSPSPPPPPPRGGYGRRGQRSPSPRGRYSGGRGSGRDLPTSLLVRNLRHDCRPEDLRRPFGQFGVLKDIYLPKDYYTGEPRGFGFVQFVEPSDAEEAKYQMDGQLLLGREVTVVFAEENRKKPSDMRHRERASSRTTSRYRDRRRSPPRYSRSPPPRRARSRSHSRGYYSPPKRRDYSRSVSPQERRYSREKSFSRSPPPYEGSRSRSQSPVRGPSWSGSRSRSPRRNIRRSRSPINEGHPRAPNGDRSPSP
ncbi:serine/arginine-rich SC35-like splicing factor SCL30A [Pyrus x bretschneideri]|uniref:serine/arginine-rich SC35-like splicing factor SCL30A n=1 Tax=Pyrus x bretschneideri TaxID=225117 RepID=UPI00202EC018|nr:serine/arginine-rich SC35-like splicing factor SCL30A [Pyrus x bretschneideri]XP_048426082.1 serine/arginine-rich SC35-like splicing factor SCL30A [Pyrus x bretschneideri]